MSARILDPLLNVETIAAGLMGLMVLGGLYELRALGPWPPLMALVSSSAEAARWIVASVPADAYGVYITMNPLAPGATAPARDVSTLCRRWVLVDIDPVRPAGVSATEAEMQAALMLGNHVAATLGARGWPQPRIVASGNGCHLLYPVELPNDEDSTALVRSVLSALATEFDTRALTVDTSVSNPSRIVRAPGTVARKGLHTAERPHRIATLFQEAA